MYRLQHYLQYTIRQFFHDKYVRIEILKLVKSATASISVSWANITGSISDNADLQEALDGKADKSQLPVAGTTDHFVAVAGADGSMTDSGYKASDFATAAQGAKADTATQPADLADYATTASVTSGLSAIDMIKVANNSGTPLTDYSLIVMSGGGVLTKMGWSGNAGTPYTFVQRRSTGAVVMANPVDPTDGVNLQTLNAATKSKAELLALTPLEDPQTPEGVLLNQLIAALKA